MDVCEEPHLTGIAVGVDPRDKAGVAFWVEQRGLENFSLDLLVAMLREEDLGSSLSSHTENRRILDDRVVVAQIQLHGNDNTHSAREVTNGFLISTTSTHTVSFA
ncbi:TPA: hypothetical protein DDY56_00030 [Candidatus Uhrbacteria bacterium]|nr:MAG: hypothetical protein A2317_00240 [Candidatus Uhrbacteria bacterium RIFOXYB2_FULL_41_10]OGL95585.1 MAG: hypothetical protein A2258_01980 [Candidatus Uhrbacteria bacterium RIFOXYA2_FULL_41_8]HAL49908.1 hypothetical protein [Candidatus Uhrbacteria bacterium]HAN06243.1 hypothetical protein [Candidatus Uhrbacteria bacterium]HAP65691.1 hypothetical protein [Candidatus Uhrbacteria bacterium]